MNIIYSRLFINRHYRDEVISSITFLIAAISAYDWLDDNGFLKIEFNKNIFKN